MDTTGRIAPLIREIILYLPVFDNLNISYMLSQSADVTDGRTESDRRHSHNDAGCRPTDVCASRGKN